MLLKVILNFGIVKTLIHIQTTKRNHYFKIKLADDFGQKLALSASAKMYVHKNKCNFENDEMVMMMMCNIM